MTASIKQIRTLGFYDFLLTLRQRTLPLSTVIFSIVLVIIILITRPTHLAQTDEDILTRTSTLTMYSIFPVIHLFIVFLLPIIIADIFTRETHYEVSELVQTLPMRSSTYLLGKLAGLAAAIVTSFLAIMLIIGIAWWIFIYPFDIGAFLSIWLVGVIPIAIIHAALATLLTVGQQNRRRAVLLDLAFGGVSTIMISVGLSGGNSIIDFFNLGRPMMLQHYINIISGDAAIYPETTLVHLLLTIGAGVLEVILLAFWAKWRLSRLK